MRERLIHWLGGFTELEFGEAECGRLRWMSKYESAREQLKESRDGAKRCHQRYVNLRERMAKRNESLKRRILRGEPILCPVCGETELNSVSHGNGKRTVRCIPRGHVATWGENGVLMEHEQRMKRRIRDDIEREFKR